MHGIFIIGFIFQVTAIKVWKVATDVNWTTALHACTATQSRIPRVTIINNTLALEDDIPLNFSTAFWLGAVYETLHFEYCNVSDGNLEFPNVCCGVFPRSNDECIDNCVSCREHNAYKCTIGERSDIEGINTWIQMRPICSPNLIMSYGHKPDKYWTFDIGRVLLDSARPGENISTCTYSCNGFVHARDCSNSLGIDALCVTEYSDNLTSTSKLTTTDLDITTKSDENQSTTSTTRSEGTFISPILTRATISRTSVENATSILSVTAGAASSHSNATTSTNASSPSDTVAGLLSTGGTSSDNYATTSTNASFSNVTSSGALGTVNAALVGGVTGAAVFLITITVVIILIIRMIRRKRRETDDVIHKISHIKETKSVSNNVYYATSTASFQTRTHQEKQELYAAPQHVKEINMVKKDDQNSVDDIDSQFYISKL